MLEIHVIKTTETAFTTGVDPSLICVKSIIGRVASELVRNNVVLKFSKDRRNATAAAPMMAGLKNGIVIYQITSNRFAPRLYAASSRLLSNFFNLAIMTRVTKVVMKED